MRGSSDPGRRDRMGVSSVQERAGRLARHAGWPNADDQQAADILGGLIAVILGCMLMILGGLPIAAAGGVVIVFVLAAAYVTSAHR